MHQLRYKISIIVIGLIMMLLIMNLMMIINNLVRTTTLVYIVNIRLSLGLKGVCVRKLFIYIIIIIIISVT